MGEKSGCCGWRVGAASVLGLPLGWVTPVISFVEMLEGLEFFSYGGHVGCDPLL